MQDGLGWRTFALWTLAFCMHRIAVLWWGFNGVFYWEETYRLLISEALWQRWPWPILDLQADPYAGGSLVISTLAVPVVALVGASLIGLKLVALAWSALGLVAWMALIHRWWGRPAAQIFAFLFIFAPPLFVAYNLIAMGSHAELVTLVGVQLLLAYRYLYGERSTAALIAWAASAGFGTWFTYDSILPFLVCVSVGIIGGTLPPRRWLPLAGGFLLGFAPWIVTNVASGGRGLDVVLRTFRLDAGGRARSLATILESMRYLVQTGIPLGLQFPKLFATVMGEVQRYLLAADVYCALYVASWIVVAWKCFAAAASGRTWVRANPELPLLVLFPALVPVLAVSDQVFLEHELVPFFSFRLLVPFLPAVFGVLAIAAARLPAKPRWAMLVALACVGIVGTTHELAAGSSERAPVTARARALGAQAVGHLLYYKHTTDVPLIAERIRVMPDELQPPAWEGFGFSLAYHDPSERPIATFIQIVMQVPAQSRADLVRGIRTALGPGMDQVKPRPPSPHTAALLTAVMSLGPLRSGQ
jgi:hypothetical protein